MLVSSLRRVGGRSMAQTNSVTRVEQAVRVDERSSSIGHDLATGVLAGQIAGLVMAVVVMLVFTLFLGKGPLYPVQVIGSFIYGDAALHGLNVPALIAGLLLHQLGPALFWGAVF